MDTGRNSRMKREIKVMGNRFAGHGKKKDGDLTYYL